MSGSAAVSRCLVLATVFVASLVLGPSQASESGSSHYPAGAQSTYTGLLPPPGTTSFFGYSAFYSAGSVRDDNGNAIPGLELELLALAPRIVHTWKDGWLGFNLSSGLVFQVLWLELQVGNGTESASGPALFGIEPLHLQRSIGDWHFVTGPIVYMAIGRYDPAEPLNQTLNYDSYAFQFNTTWTPTKIWEMSMNAAVEFKEKNRETDYKSGDTFSLTVGTGVRPFPDTRWDLGATGFYVKQYESDEQNGQVVPGGMRVEKLAFGPKLVYWFAPGTAIVAQWHHEVEVENAPEGDLFWLEWVIPL